MTVAALAIGIGGTGDRRGLAALASGVGGVSSEPSTVGDRGLVVALASGVSCVSSLTVGVSLIYLVGGAASSEVAVEDGAALCWSGS